MGVDASVNNLLLFNLVPLPISKGKALGTRLFSDAKEHGNGKQHEVDKLVGDFYLTKQEETYTKVIFKLFGFFRCYTETTNRGKEKQKEKQKTTRNKKKQTYTENTEVIWFVRLPGLDN